MPGCDVQEFVRWVLSPLRRAQRDALGRLAWDWQGLSPSGLSFPAHPVLLLENLWDAHPSLSLLSAELILLPLSPDKGFSISSRVATQLPTEQVQVIPRRLAGSCGSSRANARGGEQQPFGPLSPRLSRGCNSGLGCFCRHGSRGTEGNGWCLSADFWNSSQFEIHVASVIVSLVTRYCYHNPLLSVWPASNEVSSVHQQLLCSLCPTTVCATITSFSCSVFSFRADIPFFFFFSLAFLNHFQQGNGKKTPPFLLSFPAPGGLKSRKLEEEDLTNKSSLSRSVDELPDELSLAIARGKDWQKALPSAAGKPHFLWSRLSSGACSGCAVTNCGPQSRTPLWPRRLWPLHQRGTYIQSAPQSRNQGTAGN